MLFVFVQAVFVRAESTHVPVFSVSFCLFFSLCSFSDPGARKEKLENETPDHEIILSRLFRHYR